jgi:hypothetical protein
MYTVRITQTTGKIIEKVPYHELARAQEHYKQVIQDCPYKRVLVLLVDELTPATPTILALEYIEGVIFKVKKQHGPEEK